MPNDVNLEDEMAALTRTEPRPPRMPVSDYAPRRARQSRDVADETAEDSPQASMSDEARALTPDIEENAFRVSRAVGNAIENERRTRAELDHERARSEQLSSRITALESDNAGLKAMLDAESSERVRLTTIFETIGGNVADALHGRK